MKYFVSCITDDKQVGLMQFESDSLESAKRAAEELAPCRCHFRLYQVPKFDDGTPVGVFVSAEEARNLGY